MRAQRNAVHALVAVSLAAVVALPLFTAVLIVPTVTRLAATGLRSEAERTAAHLSELFFDAAGLLPAARFTPAFRTDVAGHLSDFDIQHVKVFAPSGEIVFSDDPAEEGKFNTKRYFREVVAAGRTHTVLVRRDGRSQEGRRLPTDVVESYVPVMRDGRFAGAVEVYYDISGRTTEVERVLGRLRLATVLVGAASLAAVAALAVRAERALRDPATVRPEGGGRPVRG